MSAAALMRPVILVSGILRPQRLAASSNNLQSSNSLAPALANGNAATARIEYAKLCHDRKDVIANRPSRFLFYGYIHDDVDIRARSPKFSPIRGLRYNTENKRTLGTVHIGLSCSFQPTCRRLLSLGVFLLSSQQYKHKPHPQSAALKIKPKQTNIPGNDQAGLTKYLHPSPQSPPQCIESNCRRCKCGAINSQWKRLPITRFS